MGNLFKGLCSLILSSSMWHEAICASSDPFCPCIDAGGRARIKFFFPAAKSLSGHGKAGVLAVVALPFKLAYFCHQPTFRQHNFSSGWDPFPSFFDIILVTGIFFRRRSLSKECSCSMRCHPRQFYYLYCTTVEVRGVLKFLYLPVSLANR